ncbi:RagB/SusD family nutrient uptake outer membrane protein [Tamlana sp. 2_MG-2023]|uniref:RagB/SusD family nutrient uptake outer membrane protein n=1 Tax=unclassified Tamlana TaxID=2614803 RepID=UPI0026E1C72F|nr:MULTISPECIES: RagB/SusD family nutrient uptake outer membrane protein [unclassified Tamlana]MDO6760863.1 RagB/SusD family nutrient uptake outer membrane protein [Tamlana sp. 2_MG-2023]MDO6791119.1 RagB/SusD family nutrient uptake outer membrane protein [Tamlana sp. 1_MG-2023]
MKKTYLKTLLVSAISVLAVGCSSDFLEETPTENISVDDVAKTGEIYAGVLAGTLTGISNATFTTGTGGTTDHEDFGQKGYDVYLDFLSGDLALTANNYNRYGRFVQFQTTNDFTQTIGNYTAWRYYYRLISYANGIIDAIGGNNATITPANAVTMGQAKTMRAYAYFYLTQLYIPEYTPTSKVLPLYIDSSGVALPQSETQEVYAQMVDDLTQSVTLLDGYSRSELYQVNQSVAKSLLAYVYAAMGGSSNNLKARDLANEVIAESGVPITTKEQTVGGFNRIDQNPSWLWGIDITTDAGLDLISWWGQVDIYTYSYQWAGDKKAIDENLYNAIDDNDIRKTQFANADDVADEANQLNGTELLIPFKKFYNGNRVRGGQRVIEDDYVFMRIDELYLLSAELSAREGFEAEAKDRLKEILVERFDDPADYAYVDALTGQDLQDEIYLQTRIEFFGEGKSFLALKRNKGTVTRGPNHAYLAGESWPYNDDILTFEVPQSEVQNNPFIN